MNEQPNPRAVPGEALRPEAVLGIRPEDRAAYDCWRRLHDGDLDRLRSFNEAYCGPYESAQAWALDLVVSMELAPKLNAAVPDWFHPYLSIDLANLAQDFVAAGEIHIEPNPAGGIWVFDARAT